MRAMYETADLASETAMLAPIPDPAPVTTADFDSLESAGRVGSMAA